MRKFFLRDRLCIAVFLIYNLRPQSDKTFLRTMRYYAHCFRTALIKFVLCAVQVALSSANLPAKSIFNFSYCKRRFASFLKASLKNMFSFHSTELCTTKCANTERLHEGRIFYNLRLHCFLVMNKVNGFKLLSFALLL